MKKEIVDIVIPVYNEEDALERSVETLRAFLADHREAYDWRIVIADNASTDRTDKIARAQNECYVGNFYVNRKITGALVGVQPFGGYNMSGTCAKAGGSDYLLLFLQAKSICQRL